jgi:hypothetical protein
VTPEGVERLSIALEPEADCERRPGAGGGCEDPRIAFVEPLQRYPMAYTAFSTESQQIAFALSADLFHWERLGLATYGRYQGVEIANLDDKDASLSPSPFPIQPGTWSGHASSAAYLTALVRKRPPATQKP